MPAETVAGTQEAPSPSSEVYVPEGWGLWRHGSSSKSQSWTERTEDYQTVSTLPSLDRPLLFVRSPVVRTYPGLYLVPDGKPNSYIQDLEIDVIMPQSDDYLETIPSETAAERLAQDQARKLLTARKTGGFNHMYIPNGEVLVRVAELPKPNATAPRRIVYVPLPFYYEYEHLSREQQQSAANPDDVQAS